MSSVRRHSILDEKGLKSLSLGRILFPLLFLLRRRIVDAKAPASPGESEQLLVPLNCLPEPATLG